MLLGVRWAPCSDRLPEEHSSPCRERGGQTGGGGGVTSHPVQEHSLFPALTVATSRECAVLTHSIRAPEGQRVGTVTVLHVRKLLSPERGKDLLKVTESGWKHKNPDFQFLGPSPPERQLPAVQSLPLSRSCPSPVPTGGPCLTGGCPLRPTSSAFSVPPTRTKQI